LAQSRERPSLPRYNGAVSSSDHFSVTAAGVFVLGGAVAVVLATVIALGGYGRPNARAAVDSSLATPMKGAGGSASTALEAQEEYLLDVSDVMDASKLP
jgi:hypothetical protein